MSDNQQKGPKDTRERILEATAYEMGTSGLRGARIEAIAARAKCNKALVYRYFNDRDTLFIEAFRHQLAKRLSVLGELPNDLGDILAHWTTQTLADRDFIRLIQREAVDYNWPEDGEDRPPPVEKESRENYYDIQINMIRNLQEAGGLDPTLDSEMLFLALLGLISLPTLLPQIALLSTGLESNSPEF
ncbi:MAG: TetR/AcrR family transcriptional regulator, partial [Chloroflexota bacterium]